MDRKTIQKASEELAANPIFKRMGAKLGDSLRTLPLINIAGGLTPEQREQNVGAYRQCLEFAAMQKRIESEMIAESAAADLKILQIEKERDDAATSDGGLSADSPGRGRTAKHQMGGTGRRRESGKI